jgi:hypothetical protein
MKDGTYQRLLKFLSRLEESHLHYAIGHARDEAIMVTVAVPGERWEVEFLVDGSVEVERFVSTGVLGDAGSLDELFAVHAS